MEGRGSWWFSSLRHRAKMCAQVASDRVLTARQRKPFPERSRRDFIPARWVKCLARGLEFSLGRLIRG